MTIQEVIRSGKPYRNQVLYGPLCNWVKPGETLLNMFSEREVISEDWECKPPELFECWANVYSDGDAYNYRDKKTASDYLSCKQNGRTIKLREVPE